MHGIIYVSVCGCGCVCRDVMRQTTQSGAGGEEEPHTQPREAAGSLWYQFGFFLPAGGVV